MPDGRNPLGLTEDQYLDLLDAFLQEQVERGTMDVQEATEIGTVIARRVLREGIHFELPFYAQLFETGRPRIEAERREAPALTGKQIREARAKKEEARVKEEEEALRFRIRGAEDVARRVTAQSQAEFTRQRAFEQRQAEVASIGRLQNLATQTGQIPEQFIGEQIIAFQLAQDIQRRQRVATESRILAQEFPEFFAQFAGTFGQGFEPEDVIPRFQAFPGQATRAEPTLEGLTAFAPKGRVEFEEAQMPQAEEVFAEFAEQLPGFSEARGALESQRFQQYPALFGEFLRRREISPTGTFGEFLESTPAIRRAGQVRRAEVARPRRRVAPRFRIR